MIVVVTGATHASRIDQHSPISQANDPRRVRMPAKDQRCSYIFSFGLDLISGSQNDFVVRGHFLHPVGGIA